MGEERWVVPGIRFRIILGLSLHISIAVKENGFTVSVRAIHWIQVVQLPLRLYRLYINRGVVRVVVVLVKNGKKKNKPDLLPTLLHCDSDSSPFLLRSCVEILKFRRD